MPIQRTSASDPAAADFANDGELFEMRRLAAVLASRRIEGLKLYEPLPIGQQFHLSRAKERVARGSNQAGKTLAAAVEVSRAVTGTDPFGKYPKENGICYCVGFDGKHLADPMYKKLCKAGAFKIIRDSSTGHWRAFRPWIPTDAQRAAEARPAPPLIPPRMIEFIAWEIKKTSEPRMIKLKTGWELHFYSGNAKPPQGSQIDLAWFDEELSDAEWYPEIAARLLFKSGYFIWSATPQVGTIRLYELHERAERQTESNQQPRTVEEFVFLIDNNVHMSDEQKVQWYEKLSDEERDIRIGGDFGRINKVFPEYLGKYHEIPFRVIPPEWTRYVAIDPGRQVCGALFLAVPPPASGDDGHFFVYDELYIKNCDAHQFGEGMARKGANQIFQEFLMDMHEGAKHDTGSGRTVEEHYRDALRRVRIYSVVNGYGFTPGDTNVLAGIEAIRAWLRRVPIEKGYIKTMYDRNASVRIMTDKCPNLIWEMKHYRFKRLKGVVQEQPEQKNNHLIDCLRYLAQRQPTWVAPRAGQALGSPVYRAFKQFLKSQNQSGDGLLLGPGGNPLR